MNKRLKNWLDSLWTEELHNIENDINTWKCPVQLKRFLPVTYWVMKNNENPLCKRGVKRFFFDRYLRPIKAHIDQKFGRKAMLKYHNVVRRKAMTINEFEDWWTKNKYSC